MPPTLTPFARTRRSTAGPDGSPTRLVHSSSHSSLLQPSRSSTSSSSSDFNTPVRRPLIRGIGTPSGSPFQSYSPSSPLSKSTILPFDAEGSARAAAEARRKQQTMVSTGVAAAGSPKRRKALVRKAPLSERLSTLPQRIIDYLEPDSYTPPPSWAKYIAISLHALHFAVRLNTGRQRRRTIFKDDRTLDPVARYEAQRAAATPVSMMCWILFAVLMAISVANALYLFSSTRRYDMMRRSNPLDSPNAKTVSAPEVDDDLMSNKSTSTKIWHVLITHASPLPLIRLLLGWPAAKSTPSPKTTKLMQTLHVWDPPEFNAEFFVFFSPFIPPVIQFFASSAPKSTILFTILLIGQTRFIFRSFEQLIKDKMLLQREVMKEYDETFVYKKLFSTRLDKSVQTNEAEMLHNHDHTR